MYEIINGIVYKTYFIGENKITEYVGMEKQMLVTETDTQIILQWQIFNLTAEEYKNDTKNTTPFEYNGATYQPSNGKYVITK